MPLAQFLLVDAIVARAVAPCPLAGATVAHLVPDSEPESEQVRALQPVWVPESEQVRVLEPVWVPGSVRETGLAADVAQRLRDAWAHRSPVDLLL